MAQLISQNNIKLIGVVDVQIGNIICIKLHNKKYSNSREYVFNELALPLLSNNSLPGFDKKYHKLVIPKTPFKPNTREHWPDKGAHITIALENGYDGDVVNESALKLQGRTIEVSFESKPEFLEGMEKNDEGCGCVFYVSLNIDDASKQIIRELRTEINLKPLPSNARTHVSIAGIAPAQGTSITELQKLRKEWCHKTINKGIPLPHSILKQNS